MSEPSPPGPAPAPDAPQAAPPRWRRWLRRLAIAAVVTPAVIALVGFFAVPPLARHVAVKQLHQLLGRRVTLERVRFNPFSLSVTVEGLQVFEPDNVTPFFGFARLYVNVEAASIYRRGPVVRELSLDSPRLRLVRLAEVAGAGLERGYNFSDIVARLAAGPAAPTPPPSAEPAQPPRFSLNNLRLRGGEVTFEDRPLGGRHQIEGLDVGVPFVSTLPVFVDTFVQPGLRVRVDGAPFVAGGRTKPFKDSLETTIELRVADLDLTRFVPYSPLKLPIDVTSALLDIGLDLSFVRPRVDAPSLTVKGKVALKKLTVRHQSAAPLLGLERLEVVLGRADVTGMRFVVDKVALTGLEVHARRRPDGSLDLQHLLPPTPASPAPASAPSPAPRFELGELSVSGALHLRDETVRPALPITIEQLALTVRNLSNAPGAKAQVKLGLRASPGGTLAHEGTLSLEPLVADGTVALDGIEPARLGPYYRDQIAFDVLGGRVRLGTGYHFAQKRSAELSLSNAYVELTDLVLHRRAAARGDDFFRLGALAVRRVALDLDKRTVEVGEITSREGRVRAMRDRAGVVDLTALVPPGPPAAAPRSPPRAAPPERPWSVTLGRLEIDRWSARFEDRTVEPAGVFVVSPLGLKASGLGTAPGTRGTVDLRLGLNKLGKVAVAGSVSLLPLAADLKVELRSLEILPVQPYLAHQLNLTITDGTVSVKGTVKVATPPAPRTGPAPAPRVDFAGDIDVDSFAAVDGDEREELLKWRSLHVGALALTTEPMRLGIGEIALSDFAARVTLLPDASLNLERVVPASPAPAKPAAPATPAPPPAATASAPPPAAPITIGQVKLQGGQVRFADRMIRPTYSAELTELAGRVAGLSSDASTQADVDVRGKLDHSGVLTVAGKVNPLAKELFVDVTVALEDFELPPASPYAGKYVGYGISKGKLGLQLAYHVDHRKLEARNRVVVDQFSFGDKVKSADALKLPVRLAVAVLKDRHGVIDLDVPIAGSLDDPQFKVGRAVLKVLGNLIVKAVTAPFSLIASAFGGGDQLSRLDFPVGAAALDGRAHDKVRALATALRERPGLSFEIEGSADPQRDRDGLRRYLFERKLRAQRVLELVTGGAAVASPDDVRIQQADYSRLLEKAYKAESFDKPRTFLGTEKALPPPEMEKLMLAHTAVDDDDLRALAQRRATAVREALARAQPDSATRLFLVTPVIAAESGPGNRVELRLKKD
jgi:uncharacterized protein involved in outer membrane biogenesis